MQGVQGSGRRGRNPGGVGTGQRVTDLLFQHVSHQIRHRPHALADLGTTTEATGQAGVDVPVFVSLDPGRAFHVALANHRAGFHGGVDLVTGTVEEAGVDEHHAFFGGTDTFFQVDGGAALLVHDAHLHGEAGQAKGVFHTAEQFVGEGYFFRAVHFRLHDVDGAGGGVAERSVALDIVQRDQGSDHAVHDAFRDLVAVTVDDGRVGHQMAHVAHEHQAAAFQRQAAAVGSGVFPVGVHAASEGFATFLDFFRQGALHQPQPVAVGQDLVFGIHGGNGVFAVHDGGQRRFHQDILDAGGIGLADLTVTVDLDFEMQAIVLEQDGGRIAGTAVVADQLRAIIQSCFPAITQGNTQLTVLDAVAGRILV